MSKILNAGCAYLLLCISGSTALAGSVTIRDIGLKPGSAEVTLDTEVDRKSIEVDYVRDIVQFTINNATIYPARMLHAEKSPFSKVFAYQYSPSLVRVRFTVENTADQYKNKIKWMLDGKKLNIVFPVAVKKAAKDDDNEKSLLEKITGAVTNSDEQKAEEQKLAEKKAAEEKKLAEKKAAEEKKASEKSESTPLTGHGRKQTKLAGASNGPSPTRSFLAMVLVIGGLGLVLLYLKRKNGSGSQATKQNWLSNLMQQKRKQKPIMEVVATHVLGPKQSVVVMKIRGQQFVLAVTAENIQLITQLDSEESDMDILDDANVAASIGKMFGVSKEPKIEPVQATTPSRMSAPAGATSEASFNSFLKNSTGAGAIIARNAYASNDNAPRAPQPTPVVSTRDQIRRRLEGLQ
jgi:flagellar biogenesis protein FliO